jgi:hypothetical protein
MSLFITSLGSEWREVVFWGRDLTSLSPRHVCIVDLEISYDTRYVLLRYISCASLALHRSVRLCGCRVVDWQVQCHVLWKHERISYPAVRIALPSPQGFVSSTRRDLATQTLHLRCSPVFLILPTTPTEGKDAWPAIGKVHVVLYESLYLHRPQLSRQL